MKIIFISEELFNPIDEGIKNVVYNLFRASQSLYNQTSAICTTKNKNYPKDVEFVSLGKTFIRSKLRRKLHQNIPDIIIYIPGASGTIFSFLRLFVLKRLMAPSKTTVVALFLQSRRNNSVLSFFIRYFQPDLLLSVSESNTKYLASKGCNSVQLKLGIDTEKFIPVHSEHKVKLRRKYGFNISDYLFLHVGHINSNRQLLELAAEIPSSSSLVIVGSTSTNQDQSLLQDLQDKNAHIISSYIESIEEIYQAVDCYIFHVTNLGAAIEIPLSVLEAMSVNLPVITTDYGGLPGMFGSEIRGLYFIKRIDELSGIIEKVKSSRDAVETRNAVLQYGWDNVVKKMVSLIETRKEL